MAIASASEHALNLSLIIKEATPNMIKKFQGEFQKLGGVVELVSQATREFANIVKQHLGTVGAAVLGTLTATGGEMLKLDDLLARLGLQYGMTTSEVDKLNSEIYRFAVVSGMQADQLYGVAKALLEADYKGTTDNLLTLSETVFKFSDVTGMGISETATFAAELSKLGINSDKLLHGLGGLRANLQLSTKEFATVMQATKLATESMFAYGNTIRKITDDDMARFSKSIATLAGTMQNLGVSAETTTKIIQGMTDPMEWLNNPQMMVMLGVNLQDVQDNLTGVNNSANFTVDTLVKMREKMQQFTGGGMIQLATFSKMLGIPAREMQKMAQWTDEDIRRMAGLEKEGRDLDDLWQTMGSTLTHLERAIARLFGTFFLVMKQPMEILSEGLEMISSGISLAVSKWSEFVGWVEKTFPVFKGFFTVIGKVFGVTIATLVVGGLGILAGWLGTAIVRSIALANAILGMGASSASASAGVNILSTSVANLGRNLMVATGQMTAFQLAGAGAGAVGMAGAGATAASALAKEQQLMFSFMGGGAAAGMAAMQKESILVKMFSKLGLKSGATFMSAFGKGLGWIGVGMTAIPVISGLFKKQLTLNDIGMMLISLGPMLGLIPGVGWGVGLGAVALGALILGIGKFTGIGNRNLLGGTTQNISQNAAETGNIAQNQMDIIDYEKLRQQLLDEGTKSVLQAIEQNTKGTVSKIADGNKISQDQYRDTKATTWADNTTSDQVDRQWVGK